MTLKSKEIRKAMLRKKKLKRFPLISENLLSTGSTLLNLVCSGKVSGGFLKGGYYYIVGDSTSGKTFLALTCFAESTLHEAFKDHRLIFDDAEDGAQMDYEDFFGARTAERIEPPATYPDGSPRFSESIEELYFNLDDAIKDGRPFIYVLDSQDALSSEDEDKKFQQLKKAHKRRSGEDEGEGEGEKIKGSYGDGKAKKHSGWLRKAVSRLRKSGSIIIFIGQSRDNPAAGPFGSPKTRSGGRALRFYAQVEVWATPVGQIKNNIKGKDRQQGIYTALETKKNRFTGKLRSVTVPIYWSYGFDDLGSCVNWLIYEGHWKSKGKSERGKTVTAPEFNFSGAKEKLIQQIQDNGEERKLRKIVAQVWNEIEEACAIKRKKRYV